MGQIKNTFDKATFIKIGIGALIAGGGALTMYIFQAVQLMDFGVSTPIVVALCSIIINVIREYMSGE